MENIFKKKSRETKNQTNNCDDNVIIIDNSPEDDCTYAE